MPPTHRKLAHTSTKKHWSWRHDVAGHEAIHAVVGRKMGLPVASVRTDPDCDEGLNFEVAVEIPDELIDRDDIDTVRAICVAMAAPFHFEPHTYRAIWRHAESDFSLALEMASVAGIEAEEIYDLSSDIVHDHYPEIRALANRLEDEGNISFDL